MNTFRKFAHDLYCRPSRVSLVVQPKHDICSRSLLGYWVEDRLQCMLYTEVEKNVAKMLGASQNCRHSGKVVCLLEALRLSTMIDILLKQTRILAPQAIEISFFMIPL